MKLIETSISDVKLFRPEVYEDKRGHFFESFNPEIEAMCGTSFIQDNQSYSTKGVLRGLHYQIDPFAQSKLVRVVCGEVMDVAVDIRKDSQTYGQHVGVILSGENRLQMFIPKGFAHGFVVLSEFAIFSYKVDAIYSPEHERCIRFDHPELGIRWGVPKSKIIVSEKDLVTRTS